MRDRTAAVQFLSAAPRDPDGHCVWVTRYRMAGGEGFPRHSHGWAQVVWAPTGVVTATVAATLTVLTPAAALWIPGDAEHAVDCRADADLHCVYVDPERAAVGWTVPTTIPVGPLLAALLVHLAGRDLADAERTHAELLLQDLLRPGPSAARRIPVPADPRAGEVALALLADPADTRTLEEWGRAVGASSRTLARAFAADTDLSFTAWRTRARLYAAVELLETGLAPALVARRVGYTNPRAFSAAFTRAVGATPQAYASPPVAAV